MFWYNFTENFLENLATVYAIVIRMRFLVAMICAVEENFNMGFIRVLFLTTQTIELFDRVNRDFKMEKNFYSTSFKKHTVKMGKD